MTEADFQSKFTKWAKINSTESAAYELKICKTKSLPFSRIEEHQLLALERAKDGTIVHKISDMAMGFKPFDCMVLHKAAGYLAIMFYVPRERQSFYLIDIETLLDIIKTSKRKSLTEDVCQRNGSRYYL